MEGPFILDRTLHDRRDCAGPAIARRFSCSNRPASSHDAEATSLWIRRSWQCLLLMIMAVAAWRSSVTSAQPIEPRWDPPGTLAPIQPRPDDQRTAFDGGNPTAEATTFDPNVAPVGLDHRIDLTPRWNPDSFSAANRQAVVPETPPGGAWVCDENSCRVEPLADMATQPTGVAHPTGHTTLIGAGETRPAASSWIEQIAVHATDIDWRKMSGSLALVIGGYLGFVWLARRFQHGSDRPIPQEVIEVVGAARLDARHQLQLIRLGGKLLLICSGPEGTTNVGEVAHPQEVDHLLSLCAPPRRARAAAMRRASQVEPKAVDPNLALEQLVQSLQQAIRRTGSHAEFEA